MRDLALPISTLLIFILAFSMVKYYASPGTPMFIRFLATISFSLGFMGVVLLPIDLSRTMHYEEIPENNNENNDSQSGNEFDNVNSTYTPWLITYWSTFFLAYFFLPLVREILYSGYFTLFARVKMAAKAACKKYMIYLALAIISILALAIYMKSFRVVPVLMAIGNTYGLLLVTLLLGYGLVDVPRRMWRNAMPEVELRRTQLMARESDEALFEAVWELQDIEQLIDNAVKLVKSVNQNEATKAFPETHPLEKLPHSYCVEELVRLRNLTAVLTPELQDRRAGRPSQPHSPSQNDNKDGDSIPTIDELAMLSARLKLAQANLVSAEQKWNMILQDSMMYSKLINGEILPPDKLDTPLSASFPEKILSSIRYFNDYTHYIWMVYLRSCTYRVLGFSTACLSAIVLWSEATMAIQYNLSPFAIGLQIFDKDGLGSGLFFKISALIPLLYMSACVYTSLFKVSLFGNNCLRGSKQSPGVALVFNAEYLTRMQFPLGYNYLNMLKVDTASTNCAFSKVMSNMSTVPFLGTSFSIYAPLLILALCCFTLANGYARILRVLGINHEDAILVGDRETLDNQVHEGIVLLSRSQRRKNENGDDASKGNDHWFSGVVV